MALTVKELTGTRVQTVFTVNFRLGYLRRSYVHVYLKGETADNQLNYTWVNASQIELEEPLTSSQTLIIRRIVPRDRLVNDYEEGAILRESNLNDSYLQAIMILEEMQDGFITGDDTLYYTQDLDLKGKLDMNGYPIVNLPYPTTGTEPVRKADVLEIIKEDLLEFRNTLSLIDIEVQELEPFAGNQIILQQPANSVQVEVDGRVLPPSYYVIAEDRVTVTLEVTMTKDNKVVVRYILLQEDSDSKTLDSFIKTPMDFGAVGDGIVDDTLAVQSAFNSSPVVVLDKVYAVTAVTIPELCHVTCINNGKLLSIGEVNTRTCTIQARTSGNIVVDGNLRAVNTINFPEGLGYRQTYDTLHYENIRMEAAANTSIVGVSMAGDLVSGGAITGFNLVNNGYVNGSFPQGLVTGGGDYQIERHYLKDGVAGFVPTGLKTGEIANNASGKIYLGVNHTVNCEDNSAYLLGGEVTIGHNIAEGNEESVQINFCKSVNIGKITAVGRTLGAFNIQNAQCNIDIGEVVGRVPKDTPPEEYGRNCPTAIGYFRSGNTTIGSKRLSIGRVSGYFQLGFLFAGAGHLDYLQVDEVDADIIYDVDEPTNPWQDPTTSWLSFGDVKEVHIRNPVFRIRNTGTSPIPTFTSNNNFAFTVNDTGKGIIEGLEIYLIENDGEEVVHNHVRGAVPTKELPITNGYWRVISGTTYWVNPHYAGYLPNSINTKPTEGYWRNTTELKNRNFQWKVDDVESFIKEGDGTTQTWRESIARATQVSSQLPGSPIGTSIVPDARGQIYLDLQNSDAYYGYAIQAGKWLKITT